MRRLVPLAMIVGACGPPPPTAPMRPVVDVPARVCDSEVASLVPRRDDHHGPCPTLMSPSVTYVRARVGVHDIVSIVWQDCSGDDVGVISCGADEQTGYLVIDGHPAELDALASIGDLRALDVRSQRAVLLAGLRGSCGLATDVQGRASMTGHWIDAARDLPVGFEQDDRGLVLHAIEACPRYIRHHTTTPSVARVQARPGARGVEIEREMVDPGGGDEEP